MLKDTYIKKKICNPFWGLQIFVIACIGLSNQTQQMTFCQSTLIRRTAQPCDTGC